MKKILVTHTDLDGAGCYVLFSTYFKDIPAKDISVFCSSIENIDKTIDSIINDSSFNKNNSHIFIADICPTRKMLKTLIKQDISFIILDHHKTNMWASELTPRAIITNENNCCGTSLLYEYFCSRDDGSSFGTIPGMAEFVDTVRSYDTYEWKITNNTKAKDLAILFSILGMERFVCEYIKRYISNIPNMDKFDIIAHKHMQYIIAKKERTQAVIDSTTPKNVITTTINNRKVAFTFYTEDMDVSELSYQFLKKYTDYDIFITIDIAKRSINYRTISDDIDLTKEIAIPMGGGGHPKAAGSPISMYEINSIIQFIFRKIIPKNTLNKNNKNVKGILA